MSVFSFIKRGRQAAKEHSAKKAEQEKKEAEKTPYKHIPKHAAIDAVSGGPATWRDVDRQKIQEQNRRRSMMTANGVGMGGMMTPVHSSHSVHSMPGLPRLNSALSHVSYPSAYASPVVQIPRNYSYSGVPPGWTHQGGEITFNPIDMGGMSTKGKEVERVLMDSGRASRSSSKMSVRRSPVEGSSSSKDNSNSPVGSSGNSTSSQDDLEMKTVKHARTSITAGGVTTPNRPLSETDSVHRLHPGHARKISETVQSVTPPRTSSLVPIRNSPTRPSPSRGNSSASLAAAGIPPVPALPPMQFGAPLTSSAVSSSAASTSSSVTVVPVPSSASLAVKVATPVTTPSVQEGEEERQQQGTKESYFSEADVAALGTRSKNSRRTSKMTRFTELETINSNLSASVETARFQQKDTRDKSRPISVVTTLPTNFDEASLPPPQELVLPPPKSSKLSKSPTAKLAKKNRWSLRSSKAVAV
ncbi:hypothetical protein B0H63DRAFT_117833 [Podospora didyma]|uniref:Uncharacterized protein n=1 Tax=Podospora didyma TaxID=330526 RepID=A0AAE0NZJ5_9PEZI|nr:hypothetical protein B0H63DRAFT_117833 [Podospora didyma]